MTARTQLRTGGGNVPTLRPFEASEIVRWGGGPHCLSLPLERDG